MISSRLLYGCPRAELLRGMWETEEQNTYHPVKAVDLSSGLCGIQRKRCWESMDRLGIISSSLLKHVQASLMSLCKETTFSLALSTAVLFLFLFFKIRITIAFCQSCGFQQKVFFKPHFPSGSEKPSSHCSVPDGWVFVCLSACTAGSGWDALRSIFCPGVHSPFSCR